MCVDCGCLDHRLVLHNPGRGIVEIFRYHEHILGG